MAVDPSAAAAFILKLLGLLSKKQGDANKALDKIKKQAKVIGGVPYLPTGFEGKSLKELTAELNKRYKGLTKVSISSNPTDLMKPGVNSTDLMNPDDDPDMDPSTISSSPSSVIDTPLTACPIDPPIDPIKFTSEEIKKALEDIAKECEIRGVPSDLLKGVDVSEVQDAQCDITAAQPKPTGEFLANPSAGEGAGAGSGEGAGVGDEPADSLKKPKKTLVILNTSKGFTKPTGAKDVSGKVSVIKAPYVEVIQLKKIGDTVACGDPILNVGGKVATSPVDGGIIKKIYVTDRAKKGDKLFLIEEPSAEDTIGKVLNAAEDLTQKINELNKLKEQLGKLEPRVWTLKQIWGVYEGQYQGYISYYKKFNPLVKKIEDLQSEFNSNLEKLKSVVAIKKDNLLVWTSLNAEYTKIYDRLKEIPGEISAINTQLDVIKKEQPLYFTTKSDTGVLAAVKKGDSSITIDSVTYPTDKQYVFVPNKVADKADATPLKDINKGLADVIRPFTNDIFLYNKRLDNWDYEMLNIGGYDINTPSAFEFSPLRLVDPTNYALMFDDSGGNSQFWAGSMWKVRKDFLDRARNFANEVKGIEDSNIIEKKSDGLRTQEKTIPDDVEALANKSFDKVVEYSKNYGYYQLNAGSIYINTSSNPEATLQKLRDDAQKGFETVYAEFLKIRKRIVEIELAIEKFPTTINDIASGSCSMPDTAGTSAGEIDGEKANIITWPLAAGATGGDGAPKDDDNYKGNPQPNSPPITELKYWKKYCNKATMVNLLPLYWPIGLLIPTPGPLIKIPLPIIWKPIVVIPTPICVIVIGIAICGICPAPFVYIVNPGWPFPIGMVAPKASWFLTGIRGPKKIDDETTSKALDAVPLVTVPLKYKDNGVDKQQPLTMDVAPYLTELLPLIQDDLPAYERLTLSNLAYVTYLMKWCAAGKKTMGFFENP